MESDIVVCPQCKGTKIYCYPFKINDVSKCDRNKLDMLGGCIYQCTCSKCGGSGYIDWIQNITNSNINHFNDDLYEALTQTIEEMKIQIDNEILDKFKSIK